MGDVISLNTSVNKGKSIPEGETAQLLGGANFFVRDGNIQSEVNNIIEGEETILDGIEEAAKIFCLFYDLSTHIKKEFELEYQQEIQDSVFRKAISDVFQFHLESAVMYSTSLYSGTPEGYIKALLRERFNEFESDITVILQSKFSGIRYSKYRFATHCLEEFSRRYSEVISGKV